ncbi:MAG: hypothetical protein WB781_07700 [Candidatus Sulfotelmatobacter sp.]
MASTRKGIRKRFQVNAAKVKRAQKAVGAETETEAIELALDFAISEYRKNRLVREATGRFVQSGIQIKDVYGTLRD